jgi:selenocysteine lyase/cysteine desulfurase
MSEGARKEEWLAHIETVRESMARLIGASPNEVAYTKSTAEGVNAFAHGLTWQRGDNVVIAPDIEHPNNVYPWLHLRRAGVEIRFAKSVHGRLHEDEVGRLVDRRTRVVVTTHVAFGTGIRTDLRALADVAHGAGALLFVDAAQSLGLIDVNVRTLGIDALAACVHKGLLAPYGLGVFYCRGDLIPEITPVYMARAGVALEDAREFVIGDLDDVRLSPTASRFEFGSYNFPAIYALGASLSLLHRWEVPEIEAHVLTMARGVSDRLTAAGLRVARPDAESNRSHITCLLHEGADGIAAALDGYGVRVSARRGALRVAAGPYTSSADIERFFDCLNRVGGGVH